VVGMAGRPEPIGTLGSGNPGRGNQWYIFRPASGPGQSSSRKDGPPRGELQLSTRSRAAARSGRIAEGWSSAWRARKIDWKPGQAAWSGLIAEGWSSAWRAHAINWKPGQAAWSRLIAEGWSSAWRAHIIKYGYSYIIYILIYMVAGPCGLVRAHRGRAVLRVACSLRTIVSRARGPG